MDYFIIWRWKQSLDYCSWNLHENMPANTNRESNNHLFFFFLLEEKNDLISC